jgi:hypothetical protein
MDEDVFPGLPLDKPVALTVVEPLYCTLFSQCTSFLLVKLFATSRCAPSARTRKGLQV